MLYIFASACPGPFNGALSTELALKQIAEHRTQLDSLKQEEGTILHGLGFFKVDQPPSKSIRALEKVWHRTRLTVLTYFHNLIQTPV